MFLKTKTDKSMNGSSEPAERVAGLLREADAVIIGAGAGLSTAAGFTYSGERFGRYFSDMEKLYGFHDMYSGGFYDYDSPEKMWAFWSRYIFVNRYMNPPRKTYTELLSLVKDKDYFVLTTNVDHCFQKAGFDKSRLFYTQGDYGLFQCGVPCHNGTYDNENAVLAMLADQGYVVVDGKLEVPAFTTPALEISEKHVPKCPVCGKPMSMNLRADDTFVQDSGWDAACRRYTDFLETCRNRKVVFLELGVGYNTPGIIKYPFWQYTFEWKQANYVCINKGQAYAPKEIAEKSVCVDGDITEILGAIKTTLTQTDK